MNSLRRAVIRSATSAPRALTSKPQVFSLTCASTIRGVDLATIGTITTLRCFSQTRRLASEEEKGNTPSTNVAGHAAFDGETPYGLFVRNVVFDANEQHLKEAFEKYGTVTGTAIGRDARGLSKGFGFVWFESQEDMDRAAGEANGSFWHGRRLQVMPRTKTRTFRGDGPATVPTKSLYIGNIPYESTDAELNQLFRELDNVRDVRVAVDRTTGWPRGFAHADFTDIESCTKARDKLAGTSLGGRQLRLDYAREESRGRGPRTAEEPPESTVDRL